MKVFKLVLLLFITSASLVFGQEKRYFFKYEYHPNSKYLIKYKTDMDGGYKFVGSKEVIDKIGMNEVKMKMNINRRPARSVVFLRQRKWPRKQSGDEPADPGLDLLHGAGHVLGEALHAAVLAHDDVVLDAHAGAPHLGGHQQVVLAEVQATTRSEERRVGKECRSRWSPYH